MTQPFATRHISITFALGQGSFGESGKFNTITVSGLRCSVTISKAGGAASSFVQARIYGLSLSQMNQISTLGKPMPAVRNNRIAISAGDGDSTMATVFQGTIQEAWADLRGQPEAMLVVSGQTGLLEAVKPSLPKSYKGGTDIVTIMKTLASEMNLSLENSGVVGSLANPYLPGTALEQARKVADAANFNMIMDNGVLAIWPKNGSRGGQVPLISAATGMVGYPTWTSTGISLVTLFNPAIAYGTQVQVQSIIKPACGPWNVYAVNHNLESETPGGAWFTQLECNVLGRPTPLAQ